MGSGLSGELRRAVFIFCALFMAGVALSPAANAAETVGGVNRHYVDETRRSWDGKGPRPELTSIWYPTSAPAPAANPHAQEAMFEQPPVVENAPLADSPQKYPLILISHGTGGCAMAMLWIGHYLATHGYIVAAVNHHGNTCAEPKGDPRGYRLWTERPLDMKIVLDRLLADPQFGPRIDRNRIGALGFSLGGFTVLETAGARLDQARYMRFCASPARDFTCEPQPEFPDAAKLFEQMVKTDPVVQDALKHSGDSYRDPRVRAVFAIAPVFGGGFAEKDVGDIHIPIEIVDGAGDTVAPPATNAQRYASLIHGARLTILPGKVGHYDFVPVCTDAGKKMAPQMHMERLCHDEPGVDRGKVQEEVRAMALKFFDRTLDVRAN